MKKRTALLLIAVLILTCFLSACAGGGTNPTPAAEEPSADQPVADEPTEPAETEPAAEPAATEPAADQPTADESAPSEPAAEEPAPAAADDGGSAAAVTLPIVPETETFTIAVGKRPISLNTYPEKQCVIETEALTNVRIEWNEIPESGWGEKVNIMFASDDLPDAFLNSVAGVDVVTNAAVFTPLNDLLDSYAPAFSGYMDEHPDLRSALKLPDGTIYSLPVGNTGAWFEIGDIVYINQDWLEAVGMPMPTTIEDYYNVLKAFKEQDPNGNGDPNDEIPFSFVGSADLYPLFGAFGVLESTDHVEVNNDTVSFTATKQGYREALDYFHRLYSENLMDIEGFSQTQDQLTAKGKVAPMILGGFPEYAHLNVVGSENAPIYGFLPVLESPGNEQYFPNRPLGYGQLAGFAITKECEKPEVLVKWYDYINSTFETRTLWGFGPENTTWKFMEDGLWTNTSEFLPEGMTYAEYRHTVSAGGASPVLGIDEVEGVKFFDYSITFRLDAIELYRPNFPEQVMPIGFDSPEIKEERDILYIDIDTYLKNFVATSVINGLTDAQWDEHLRQCEALRIDEYTQLWQQTYDNRK